MKCIKKNEIIKRVTNKQACEMVDNQGWKYYPKAEWKEAGRP